MKWLPLVALAVLVASCTAPQPPEEWTIEREAPGSESSDANTIICDEIRALALGSLAAETDLAPTLEELARIGAIVGATAALPALNRTIETLAADGGAFEVHDDLVTAAESIDAASHESCRVPAFSATYATTGWPSCHGELTIPVAGYTELDATRACGESPIPDHLPCWTTAAPYLPVDCNSGEVVTAVDARWEPAGEPRDVSPPEPPPPGPDEATTTTTTVIVIEALDTPECGALTALFTGRDPVDGSLADLERLSDASAGLGGEIEALVDEFIAANTDPPDLAEFEALVRDLDDASAARCGLPVVSAWDNLAGGVAELPCWRPTGLAYPAHIETACTEAP